MALVVTRLQRLAQDADVQVLCSLAFDSSYPTGGEVITANDVGLNRVRAAIIPGYKGYTFEWDPTNLKVLVYWVDTTIDGSPMLEVADTTTLVAITAAPALFFGV